MSKAAPKSGKPKSNEDVFAGFQNLRTEQRQLANKITELEMDLNEHKIVIETLEGVNKDRKCFRMVGGVLVERTVNDVLPELTANRERLPTVLQALNEQLAKKGKEVNEYMEQHEIRVQRNAGNAPQQAPADDAPGKGNVLVAST